MHLFAHELRSYLHRSLLAKASSSEAASESLLQHTTHLTTMATPTSFPFQKIPIEIRFQIYPLVCDQRKWTFCECRKHAKHLKADLTVLRTSKVIHDEAPPIIYQNHTFQLLCTIPDPDSPKNRHPVLGYKASILVCQSLDARPLCGTSPSA